MAVIKVTPDLLAAKASEIRSLKSTHDDAIAKLRTLIGGLNEIWTGDAQAAYVSKFESMQATFTTFSEMLEGYARLIDTSVQKFTVTDSETASNINSFAG